VKYLLLSGFRKQKHAAFTVPLFSQARAADPGTDVGQRGSCCHNHYKKYTNQKKILHSVI
jgi:hypothetical protein